jgi:hypothetical protein
MRFSNISGDLLSAPAWIRDARLLRIQSALGLEKIQGRQGRHAEVTSKGGAVRRRVSHRRHLGRGAYFALVSVAGAAVAPLGTAGGGW